MSKDVEFEEDQELVTLSIPKRYEPPEKGVLAKAMLDKKIVPTKKYANYILVGLSILFFFGAIIFFALLSQTPAFVPKHNPNTPGNTVGANS